jgi:hypothetical protein
MKKAFLSVCLCLALSGCRASSPTPPLAPGAVNSFDQTSYQALMAAQASLTSLKQSVALDPALAPLKAPLGQAIQDYNLADVAWQTYHASATAANQAAVTAALTKVQTDVSSIQKVATK